MITAPWWTDLSDDELLARLLEHGEPDAIWLLSHRDDLIGKEWIGEVLGDE